MLNAENYDVTEKLKTGLAVRIRSIQPDDKERLAEAFSNLEPESIYTRFFYHKKGLSEDELKIATEVDFENTVALVVTVMGSMNEIIIGAGRYVVLDGTATMRRAELAFTVEEDYHGMGIATLLLKHLTHLARAKGVSRFVAEVLSKNKAMLAVFSRSGLPMHNQSEGSVTHVTLSLKEGDT